MEYFPLVLKHRVTRLHYDLPDNIELILQLFRTIYKDEYIVEPCLLCKGDTYDDLCLKEFKHNPRMKYFTNWVMQKLILEENLSWKTVEIRLRIGVNMLYQIGTKTGGKFLIGIIRDNFVNNVWSLYRQKMVYDLPFYQGQGERDLPCPTIWSISVSLNLRLRP